MALMHEARIAELMEIIRQLERDKAYLFQKLNEAASLKSVKQTIEAAPMMPIVREEPKRMESMNMEEFSKRLGVDAFSLPIEGWAGNKAK